MEIKGVGVDPWKEYNEIVERCRTVLLCGARIRGVWIDICKIIARMMFKPLERKKCLLYMKGKKCSIFSNGKILIGRTNGWHVSCRYAEGLYLCNRSHFVCKRCFRIGGHFIKMYVNPDEILQYLCEKCI